MTSVYGWILVLWFGNSGTVMIPGYQTEDACKEAFKTMTHKYNARHTCVASPVLQEQEKQEESKAKEFLNRRK